MRRVLQSALVVTLVVAACGCAPETETETGTATADADPQQVREEIEAANARFESFVSSQNADSIAALYTSDGQLMAPGIPTSSGNNLHDTFRGMFEMGVTGIDLQTVEVEAASDFAYEVGQYNLMGPGGAEVDNGKYIVIWRLEDGEWKIHRDIFNSNVSGLAAEAQADTSAQS